jgi:hypothetical protein
MIFGFNTDVRCGDTVYHVQSEARERESLLQTQVFVSGRCVAKRATSYAAAQARPGFSAEQMHDLLRAQHKTVLELARAGEIAKVSSAGSEREGETNEEPEPASQPTTHTTSVPSETIPLALAWMNPDEFPTQRSGPVELRFFVSESGAGISDARVTVRLNGMAGAPQYAHGTTMTDGHARITLTFDPAAHGETVALLVQAVSQGRTVTRKYELRRPVS